MSAREVLVTGGSGFFGGVLKRRLLSEGFAVTNVDLVRDEDSHPALTSVQGDIRDAPLLARIFAEHGFKAVFHCAAMLAHGRKASNGRCSQMNDWSIGFRDARCCGEPPRSRDVQKKKRSLAHGAFNASSRMTGVRASAKRATIAAGSTSLAETEQSRLGTFCERAFLSRDPLSAEELSRATAAYRGAKPLIFDL